MYVHVFLDYNLVLKKKKERELITKSENLQCNETQW